jgi:hypothetical protein
MLSSIAPFVSTLAIMLTTHKLNGILHQATPEKIKTNCLSHPSKQPAPCCNLTRQTRRRD